MLCGCIFAREVMEIKKLITDELKFLVPWSLALDITAFVLLLSLLGTSEASAIALSLAVSTVAMLLNTTALAFTIRKAVFMPVRRAKRCMMTSYILRFACLGAMIVAAFLNRDIFNAPAIMIPLFYPRIAHTLSACFAKKKGGNADGN